MKNKMAAWIVLGIITIIAGVCLAVTNEVTRKVIIEQTAVAAEKARSTVLAGADSFDLIESSEAVDSCYVGKKGEEIIGYVAQVTKDGFGGPIEIIVGITKDNKITGIVIGGSDFAETVGLGAKTKDPKFTNQYIGKEAPIRIIKAGGTPGSNTIDAVTAATISSSAVNAGINAAAAFIKELIPAPTPTSGPAQPAGTTVSASATGYHGPILVEVALDASGAVTAITIGQNEDFAETEGLGTQVREDWFAAQFIGKTLPMAMSDIDAATGATVSSEAVVVAVNKAYNEYMSSAPASAGTTVSASATGYHGPILVEVTLDASGAVTAITIGQNEDFAETEGLGTQVREDWFAAQFIGKTLPMAMSDIDAATGATVSSEAVVVAVNKAYNEYLSSVPVRTGTTVSASATGYHGPILVEVTLDTSGAVTAITIGQNEDFAETEGLGTQVREDWFAAQFIGKTLPMAMSDIDAATGATISSEAVVTAVNKAFQELPGSGKDVTVTETPSVSEAALSIDTPSPVEVKEYTASKRGYGGPIGVKVSFDDTGAILSISIGDNGNFKETEGLGSRVKEDVYKKQFISLVPPLTITDIDAVTGATISTQAVVDSINLAFSKYLKDK